MASSAIAKPDNTPSGALHPLDFFGELVWIDGRPLLDTIEPYRRKILVEVLWTFGDDGAPAYNMALCGRAKKNWKTVRPLLAALYRFLAWPSTAATTASSSPMTKGRPATIWRWSRSSSPPIRCWRDGHVLTKEIVRKDGRGMLHILPARDVIGAARQDISLLRLR